MYVNVQGEIWVLLSPVLLSRRLNLQNIFRNEKAGQEKAGQKISPLELVIRHHVGPILLVKDQDLIG